jgi:hypothetical protein
MIDFDGRRSDERLKWLPDDTVRVQIGKIIAAGSAPRQTVEGRRKRFRTALTDRVRRAGGEEIAANRYRPPL